MPYPDELVLPLRQHAGKAAKLCVKVGDHVERGDTLGNADGFMSVPIHASAAGTVTDVDWWPHPDGSMAQAVRIAVDRYAPQVPRPRLVPRWEGLTVDEVVQAVQDAGVVGPGRRGVPDARQAGAAEGPRGAHADHQRRGVRAVPHVGPSHDGGVSRARALRHPRDDADARRHEVRSSASSATSPTPSPRWSARSRPTSTSPSSRSR